MKSGLSKLILKYCIKEGFTVTYFRPVFKESQRLQYETKKKRNDEIENDLNKLCKIYRINNNV